ncbi:MAG: sulfotransferase domain-containing protein [Planctomycetota bacterium]
MKKPQGPRPYPRLRQVSYHITWLLGTRFPRAVPLVFVLGYPKSGTTWASQLVADYLRLPFPRFSLLPIACEAVVQGHQRVWKSYRRGVYVLRDGRDALVSQYFQLTRHIPEGDHPPLTRAQRRALPGLVNKSDVRGNMTAFIERQLTKPVGARVHWGIHARSYFEASNRNIAFVRYEDLLSDGEAALAAVVSHLTGEDADLERVRLRARGQEDRTSFLRKGKAGDWVNHFTVEAAEIFDRHCGDMLIEAGYEPDHSWVRSFGERADTPPPVEAAPTGTAR